MRPPPTSLRLETGRPYPLGAHWDGLGVNFAVYSANAEAMELCLFDVAGRRETARLRLPECSNEIWHGYLRDATLPLVYGYRASGPYQPEHGHRFNPHKLLLDPYARELVGNVRWSDALFGYRLHSARADLSFDRRDSATAMPKALVGNDSFNWGDDRPPRVPWTDTVIYEAHVRGSSMRRKGVRNYQRGSFAALGDPKFIEHLRRLGITAVELLPVHAFLQDRFLIERGLSNYWGYNTLAYFAPEPRYLSSGSTNEIRALVRRLHSAGIEVILDVVYNHTCEGNELGPTLSMRGFDNASYYRLAPDNARHHINDTGTGNTINMTNGRVVQLVLDSLRHWVQSYHVDGFRFDLASTLGREPNGFEQGNGFFDAVMQDPILANVKLIAEPWDIGPGGYQLGNFPPGFSEWNDRFRDTTRRFWRGDAGQIGDLAARLSGSNDIFGRRHRRPIASINYLASHDGFTLEDLVSYEHRHNEANGENNNDGHGENYSANWGEEGPTDDAAVIALRARVKRAMLTTLFCSQGTPMLLAGDEFAQTQNGNNNAYCQDNEITWLDWARLEQEPQKVLYAFTQRLMKLRKHYPALRSRSFLDGHREIAPGLNEIGWFDMHGQGMTDATWRDEAIRTLSLRRASRNGNDVDVVLLLLNAGTDDAEFALPPPVYAWSIVLDSADPAARERTVDGEKVGVGAHVAMLLVAKFTAEEPPA
ncbi:MAG TPA: glycogen debranching protein GlgX [Rudaea sp.]|jgi:glycogen operon protein|nr:glycogen debranching protein GlgX [Rudaea sp.]